jgi:glycosyltransferase involved in cell wall biosynthesis
VAPAEAVPVDASLRTLVAIPVHNELAHARRLLPRLVEEVPYDVLVVDDASTDGSSELMTAAAERGELHHVRHEANRGYGGALATAFDWSHARGYDWVITMDCDEQHDPANLPAFARAIAEDDADIISGTRYHPRAVDGDLPPPERRLVNLVLTRLVNELFGWSLTDTFCGFKAHRVVPTAALELDEFGYAFPMQLWPRAYAADVRVREIPVRRIYNDADRSFGHDTRAGDLDDAAVRLRHYLNVLRDELCRLGLPPLRDAVPQATDLLDGLDLRDMPAGGGELRQQLRDAAGVPC